MKRKSRVWPCSAQLVIPILFQILALFLIQEIPLEMDLPRRKLFTEREPFLVKKSVSRNKFYKGNVSQTEMSLTEIGFPRNIANSFLFWSEQSVYAALQSQRSGRY